MLSKLGLLGYLVRHRRAPVFRDAQPVFCGITIMGGVMGDFTPLFDLNPNPNTDPNPDLKPAPSPDPSPHLARTTGDFTPLLLFGPVSDTRCHGFVAYLLLSVSMAIVSIAIVSITMAIDSWHTRYYR